MGAGARAPGAPQPGMSTMAWSTLAAACAALGLLALPAAQASHMGMYQQSPLEHDGQGTVLEPDGLSTSVLGPVLVNTVLDLPPFDGRGTPDPVPRPSGALGSALAPGCTGGAPGAPERRVQGQCALWSRGVNGLLTGTVPAPVAEAGMAGNAAPGGYTPTKASVVRFLDGHLDWTVQPPGASTVVVDVNAHLRELGRVSGQPLPGEGNVLPGQSFAWAWYGQWADLNGNGVVDHQSPADGLATGRRANEFAWLGGCLNFDGAREPLAVQRGLCIEDGNPHLQPPGAPCADPESVVGCAGTTLHGWMFPGNHHAAGPADDAPGQQVLLWANLLFDCQGPPTCDDIDRDSFGDPLLGVQDERTEDLGFHDRTGDIDGDSARQWAGGLGWASMFYGDDGLLVTFVQAWGVNCAPSAQALTRYDLGSCTFLDVDRQRAVSPGLEEMLVGDPEAPGGGLKAQARAAWMVVRDAGTTAFRAVQAVGFGHDVYLATQGPLQGQVNDLALQAGWSREPNSPGDAFPGTTYRACSRLPVGDPRNPTAGLDAEELEAQHRGWCNAGAGGVGTAYDAYRQGQPRGWLDAQARRNLLYSVPVTLVPGEPCQYCLAGPLLDLPFTAEPGESPPSASDHGRTLGPGGYWFGGTMGTWRDRAALRDEAVFPEPSPKLVGYPADGWVGLAARNGGQWVYRGFLPRECTTERDAPMGASVRSAAECNPYLDGNVEDPQDYTHERNGGEFRGACDNANLLLAFWPADGSLDSQVLVWHEHEQGLHPDPLDLDQDGNQETLPRVEAYGPGPVEPLELGASCSGAGTWLLNDYLVWAEGNAGDVIHTRMTKSILLGADLDGDGIADADVLTDEDVYVDWEPL